MTTNMWRRVLTAATILATSLGLAVIGSQPTAAQTFNVIYSFNIGALGVFPYAGVTLDAHGNIYGTNNVYGVGYGTVYKLTYKDGAWTADLLYEFLGENDGAFPASRVVFGPDGSLYGTTSEGGGTGCNGRGCGKIFKLMPPATICRAVQCPWTETVLYRFTGGADGAIPEYGDIIFDSAGSIYGTTSGNSSNFGSVYKLTNSGGVWTETTLYAFTGGTDGFFPMGGVTFDRAGNLYGTMDTGVFELLPSQGGWTETVLHTFQYQTDGLSSEAGVIFDNQGNLYSDTFTLGPDEGGTMFEMTPAGGSWNFQVLYPFNRGGGTVGTSLIFDGAGNLYGVRASNANDDGEAFKMSLVDGSWTYTVLHEFSGGYQGSSPYEGMVMDANGNLWGTASGGGAHNYGMVYEITP
jgi:uncharacterized repeat protein (TIGR03803 family)